MGLAVAAVPGGEELVAAITDASKRCVLEVAVPHGAAGERASGAAGGSMGGANVLATHDRVIGTFVGDVALSSPTDVAYVVEDGELHLYAADGHDRVVRLR